MARNYTTIPTSIMTLRQDLKIFSQWFNFWLLPSNLHKYMIFHFGRNNTHKGYLTIGPSIKSHTTECDLGIVISNDLKIENICSIDYKKINRLFYRPFKFCDHYLKFLFCKRR